jgi:APA family basic amino acid/polyamine antiporter
MSLGRARAAVRRKSLAELEAAHPSVLARSLGATELVSLGIGAIIGAGIFLTVGTAAAGQIENGIVIRYGAGPAIVVSFLVTAVTCGFSALCYAEMAAMIPIAGSAYTYAYATMGELVAWIIGWDLLIEYAAGNVAVAISWAGTRTACSAISACSWARRSATPNGAGTFPRGSPCVPRMHRPW